MEKVTTKAVPAVLMLALAAVLVFSPVAESDADTQKLPPVIGEDMSTDGDFSLMKDTLIEEGGSLTLSGSLDLDGKTLTVEGKLILKDGAVLTDGGVSGSVVLSGKGTADLDGTVGDAKEVKFCSTAGSVSVCQVSGLDLSVVKSGETDTLSVSGSPRSVSDRNVFVTSGVLFGDMSMNDLKDGPSGTVLLDGKVSEGSTLSVGAEAVTSVKVLKLLSGSEIVIEGTIYSPDGKDVRGYVELKSGAKADIRCFSSSLMENGYELSKVPRFVAETGIEGSVYGLTYSSVSLINLHGIVLEALTKETPDGPEHQLAITQVAKSVGITSGNAAQPELVFTGTVTVPEDVVAEFPDDAVLTSASGGLLDVQGILKLAHPVKDYKGSHYTVGKTYVYTDFDTAFASGADSITVRGGFVFDRDYTMPEGMKLHLDQELVEKEQPVYAIPEGRTFTVSAGSSVGPETNFTDIDGTLKVSLDGDCVPSSGSYVDSWMTDGYRVYSGTPEPEGTSIFSYLAGAVVLIGGLLLGIAVFRRSH